MYKVLMVAPTPFFADRGCHVRIYGEARILQEMGHRVTIYTYHNGRNLPGLDIRRIIDIPWYRKLEAGPSYHKFYLDIILLIKLLKNGIYEKPDIIHAHLHEGALLGSVVAKLKNIPLVFDFQGSLTGEISKHGFVKERSAFFYLFKKVEKFVDNSADAIIVSSLDSVELLEKEFAVSRDKFHIVEDGIDTEGFKPDCYDKSKRRREFSLPDNDNEIVIYQGLLNKYQGIDSLLEAIPLLLRKSKKVHFLILGYPDVDKYRDMAKERGIEDFVTFTGRVNYEETIKYLSLADIAISPKLSTTEWNGKLLYYMAAELPVVVFDSRVNREILGDLGIYAKPGDVSSLAEKIESLLLEKELRRNLGRKLRERVSRKYSWRSMGERITKIYKELLTRGKG